MVVKPDTLKLIYVLKIGTNSADEGLYEFLFIKNIDKVDSELDNMGWINLPASENAQPPSQELIDNILYLKTDIFELICLHNLDDRKYSDGYYKIHALAYEDIEDEEYESSVGLAYDDLPPLVFHFGMTQQEVEDVLYTRDIALKGNEFVFDKIVIDKNFNLK